MKRLSKSLRQFADKQDLLRLSYLDSKGYARVVPVWFAKVRGKYCVGTGTSSAKWQAILRNAKVGWVIDGGKWPHYKAISEVGKAVELKDPRSRSAAYRALSQKYFKRPAHPKFVEIYGEADDPETVYFLLEPQDGTGWEY